MKNQHHALLVFKYCGTISSLKKILTFKTGFRQKVACRQFPRIPSLLLLIYFQARNKAHTFSKDQKFMYSFSTIKSSTKNRLSLFNRTFQVNCLQCAK